MNKEQLKNKVIVCKELLSDIEDMIDNMREVKFKNGMTALCDGNKKLVNRNRLTINKKLAEIEKEV